MKQLSLLLSFILATATSYAQIQVGSAQIPTMNSAGSLDAEDLAAFRKTTTVFYIQEGDADRRADFETALREVWTITPFIVATPDEMDRYADGRKYSEGGFGGYVVQRTSRSGMTTTHTHLSYDISITEYDKKGKEKGRKLLARFLVSPDAQTLMQSVDAVAPSFSKRKRDERSSSMMRTLYTKSRFSNWGPGYLRGYAKAINDGLTTKTRRGIFSGTREDGMSALQRDTLFLPRSLKNRYSPYTGAEREADADEDEGSEKNDMRSSYAFKSHWIDDDALQQRILTATKPVYYVAYVRSSSDKHVAVFNGQNGKLLYADYTPISYNFKGKDLKKIAKVVD